MDRAKYGSNLLEAIDIVQHIDPYLSLQQPRWYFKRALQKNNPNFIKPKLRVAQ